jgi:putative addiction module killer protein
MKITILEYLDERGNSLYSHWFKSLHAMAAAKVVTALSRLENGNFSRVEGVGSGIYECKINFGPGYRVYFGKDGEELIILLGGGSKQKQSADISAALACWQNYKRRKR